MIDVENLRKVFMTHKGEEITAVNSLAFKVLPGEIYGLLGPNGAGKTTTLRMLAGLMTPTVGKISVAGVTAVDLANHIAEPLELKKRIGFLTANTGLYQRLTPREVLTYFGELRGQSTAEIKQQTDYLIQILDMGPFADQRCEGLSTGQRQRVQIARTLVGNPPVLILDEPTLGLDVLSNQLILRFIAESGKRGRTIILSTHFLDEVEDIATRLAEGTLEELRILAGKTRLSDIFRELVERADGKILPEGVIHDQANAAAK
jgi:sodium transport system ATP-binding protein